MCRRDSLGRHAEDPRRRAQLVLARDERRHRVHEPPERPQPRAAPRELGRQPPHIDRLLHLDDADRAFIKRFVRTNARELLPAEKKAFGGVDLRDLKKEVAILQSAHHDHLLPLFGFCLDSQAPCLVFPLMVGGSLRARMDRGADDLAYLYRMGRFTAEAPPAPLTWRRSLPKACGR